MSDLISVIRHLEDKNEQLKQQLEEKNKEIEYHKAWALDFQETIKAKDAKIAEAREIINQGVFISKSERDSVLIDFDENMEFEAKAKAWLESNK